jgi:microcystin-dependent protein
MSFGTLTGIDTRGSTASAIAVGDETWAEGDILFAHPTVAGKLTKVRPQHDLAIAFITVRHASTGQIAVRIVPGNNHLEWMHDVLVTGPANHQSLVYNSTSSLWVNRETVSYQASAPTGPMNGDIWIDSDATASVLNTNDFLTKNDFELFTTPIGGVTQYAGATSPSDKWAICSGAAVSRTTYSTLFARIGTTYGSGDGSTTFNLPNLKGRVVAGVDLTQTEFDTLGETGGAKTHTLTTAEMPSHGHNVTSGFQAATGGSFAWGFSGSSYIGSATALAGGGGAHNNLQPYIVMNYLIRIA